MAWVAVDKDGTECVYSGVPSRNNRIGYWETYTQDVVELSYIQLPQGTIKKLIGRELTWDDEPVELK